MADNSRHNRAHNPTSFADSLVEIKERDRDFRLADDDPETAEESRRNNRRERRERNSLYKRDPYAA